MKKNRARWGYLRFFAAVVGSALTVPACSAGEDAAPESAGVEQPIIAGVPANGAKLNAIGSIGYAAS